MTAIAAVIDRKNKKTFLASDQLGSNQYTGKIYKTEKLFKNGPVTFACCGSYRVSQVLRRNLKLREFQVGESVESYIYDYMDDAIRGALRKMGALKKDDDGEAESIRGSEFLIAIKDRVFVCQSDFSLLEAENDFIASGSGEYHMEASIFTQMKISPKKPLKEVLEDSIRYTSSIVLSVGGEPKVVEHLH